MITRAEYGIICNREDEKEPVDRINKYMTTVYQHLELVKAKDTSISAFNYGY